MCGIAGYVGPRIIADGSVEVCMGLMHRRGPDSTSFYRHSPKPGRNVLLVNSRLKIIDLDDRANQPFRVGTKVMVYNGELYNYVEMRGLLNGKGRRFATESDTEVLLQAIDELGWEALEPSEGMWAFAVYDEADDSLTLCRDRFGEKPLYVYRDSSGIYFGSEVKFIVSLLGRRLDVNFDHLYRYMVNGYKALYKGEHTFFDGLSSVPAASYLRVDGDRGVKTKSYWRPCFAPDDSLSYKKIVSGARERLIRSVELRLRADVPLAFCMSGGVDSNSLISIAKNVFDYDVHGFTITNEDARYEEQEMVDYSVAELGIRHTSIPVTVTDFLPRLRSLVRYHDAPVYTITYYAQWLLSQSIADHGYRVSVSGTAADELFSGYFDHHLAYLNEVQDDRDLHAASRTAWEERVRPVVRNPYLSDPDLFLDNPDFRGHIFLGASDFSGYLVNGWYESFAEGHYTDSLLRNRMMNEMFHEAVPMALHEDDLNSMYFSIENRSPYLDRDLFEFCYSVPSKYLIRNGLAKVVLRDAMRGIVPQRILDNPRKVGFNAPIFSFLDTADPEVRSYLLDDSPIFDHVRRDKIESLIGRDDMPNSESKFLFYFINAKMFLEEFGTGKEPEVPLRVAS